MNQFNSIVEKIAGYTTGGEAQVNFKLWNKKEIVNFYFSIDEDEEKMWNKKHKTSLNCFQFFYHHRRRFEVFFP